LPWSPPSPFGPGGPGSPVSRQKISIYKIYNNKIIVKLYKKNPASNTTSWYREGSGSSLAYVKTKDNASDAAM
jgi:hypothetical protein